MWSHGGQRGHCADLHHSSRLFQVATPYVFAPPYIFGRTNVSLHLVKKGLATVYTQMGAAYGTAGVVARFFRWIMGLDKVKAEHTSIFDRLFPLSGEARLKRAMARAKRKKLGIWGLSTYESPEDYKKRTKSMQ